MIHRPSHQLIRLLAIALLVAGGSSCKKKFTTPEYDNPYDETSERYIPTPDLNTAEVTAIKALSASSGGQFQNDYGKPVTAKGVCWSLTANPTIEANCSSDGSATTNFASDLTGLLPDTVYYVRAYATNDAGTIYGGQRSFRTLDGKATFSGLAISGVTSSGAVVAFRIDRDGGDAITARGVCWSKEPDPTIAGTCAASGTGTGAVSVSIADLDRATIYYVRPYATNAAMTTYGGQASFLTLAVLPAVETGTVSEIGATSAIVAGTVTSEGGASQTVRGVCYATTQNPTTANTCVASGSGEGAFTSNLSGLSMGTVYYARAFATNAIGTVYGSQVSFTTLTGPTVSTGTISSLSATGAIVSGTVTADGGSPVTARGVCFATTPSPTLESTCVDSGSGVGSFNVTLSGLQRGTTYVARAYATNSIVTSYGVDVSFTTYDVPTVTTGAVTNVTSASANVAGIVTASGGPPVTARGICYATTQNPTTADNCVASGTATGAFTAALTGLGNATTYYVRAFATNSVGTAYGSQISFSTIADLPRVVTGSVSGITSNGATVAGEVIATGGAVVTSRGICYATTQNPSLSDTCVTAGSGTGTYSADLPSLFGGRIYYIRAFATNSMGTAYGAQSSFTTLSGPPSVATGAVSNVTSTGASIEYTVLASGGANVTSRGVCVSTSPEPVLPCGNWGSGVGTFTAHFTTLTHATTYYLRAYATNSFGTSYGNEVTITTLPTSPTVVTGSVTGITSNGASVSGNVTANGGAAVTGRGVCFATTQNPSISGNCSASGTGSGNYTVSISGLIASTTYYARAYATNAAGTSYGSQIQFTTRATLPVVTTLAAANISSDGAFLEGQIVSSGSAGITSRGFCYSISENPSLSDQREIISETNPFSVRVTELFANNLYYVRAFATNSGGTAYGNQISFRTLDTIDDIDGNRYTIVQIGTQVWMADNLRTSRYRNGATIDHITDATAWATLTTGAWVHYDNDAANDATYGKLYNWYAVADSRNLCPVGWHVPTDEEWTALSNVLVTDVGFKMKFTSGWSFDGSGSNASGFSGLPGGLRDANSSFGLLGTYGIFWSTTEDDTGGARGRVLRGVSLDLVKASWDKKRAYSVRCLRD